MEEKNIFRIPSKDPSIETWKELGSEKGNGLSLESFLNVAKEHFGPRVEYEKACIRYDEQRKNIAESFGFKYLEISLSINGSYSYPFHIQLINATAERLEKLYREHSQREDFNNDDFWNILKVENEDLSFAIIGSINEELGFYLLTNRNPLLLREGQEPDDVYPLKYLHYVYLDEEEKPTTRENAQGARIDPDNQYNCDFSKTFDDNFYCPEAPSDIESPDSNSDDLPF